MTLQPDLNKYPSNDEWSEAQQRRSTRRALVRDGYVLDSGFVRIAGEFKRAYYPMTAVRLPGELRRLVPGDVDGLLAFVKRWGLLGFTALVESQAASNADSPGDPANWIWAHANGIRIALDLIQLLAVNSSDDLIDYLGKLRSIDESAVAALMSLDDSSSVDARLAVNIPPTELWPTTLVGKPWRDDFAVGLEACLFIAGFRDRIELRSSFFIESWPPDDHLAKKLAQSIVEEIINDNNRGIFQQLSYFSTPNLKDSALGPWLFYQYDCVLSVVYHHLAELALGSRSMLCEECGLPFVRSHGGQRFCPPPQWEKESRCAMRNRQKRHRKEKR